MQLWRHLLSLEQTAAGAPTLCWTAAVTVNGSRPDATVDSRTSDAEYIEMIQESKHNIHKQL